MTFSVDTDSPTACRALAAVLAAVLLAILIPAGASAAKQPHQAKTHHAHRKHHHRKHHQRPLYWGAWIGDQLTGSEPPWDMSAVSQFAQLTRKNPSLIEFGGPFQNCHTSPCSDYAFPTAAMENVRSYGSIPLYSWSSASSSSTSEDASFRLAAIVAGTYDTYVREFAEAARDWGHPFFLRFDWEMNGDWFPWSETANGNQPGEFVAAWRHVHDIFASVGATNATWVWCPYADVKHKLPPLQRYYPGDEYVNWTCLDGYNWGKNGVNTQRWRSFQSLFGPSYRAIVRRIAPRKPMMLAELASGGGGKAKAAWIRSMFRTLATKFKRVRALVWFNQVDRGVQWPLESSQHAAQAFSEGLRSHPFRPNRFGAITRAPILPPP